LLPYSAGAAAPWRDTETYEPGQFVTDAGSMWHANRKTSIRTSPARTMLAAPRPGLDRADQRRDRHPQPAVAAGDGLEELPF